MLLIFKGLYRVFFFEKIVALFHLKTYWLDVAIDLASNRLSDGRMSMKLVKWVKHNGMAHGVISDGSVVPLEIMALAAGKDAWMRDVKRKCECGKVYAIGSSDGVEWCQECYDEAGEENAIADGV